MSRASGMVFALRKERARVKELEAYTVELERKERARVRELEAYIAELEQQIEEMKE